MFVAFRLKWNRMINIYTLSYHFLIGTKSTIGSITYSSSPFVSSIKYILTCPSCHISCSSKPVQGKHSMVVSVLLFLQRPELPAILPMLVPGEKVGKAIHFLATPLRKPSSACPRCVGGAVLLAGRFCFCCRKGGVVFCCWRFESPHHTSSKIQLGGL